MDKERAYEKARAYVDLVRNVLPLRKAILFGSYAIGSPDTHSDIDIGLFIDEIDDDRYLDTLAALQSLCRKIDLSIEPHLFILGEDRTGFASWVEKTGRVIES